MSRPVIKYTRKDPCQVKGCPNFIWARGMCSRHYQAEYRQRGPPCIRKGCENSSFARGLCVKHYQQDYRKAGGPCKKRKCPNRAFSRGLCVMHYHRWYHSLLRENEVTSLKILPKKLKERIPGVRV